MKVRLIDKQAVRQAIAKPSDEAMNLLHLSMNPHIATGFFFLAIKHVIVKSHCDLPEEVSCKIDSDDLDSATPFDLMPVLRSMT